MLKTLTTTVFVLFACLAIGLKPVEIESGAATTHISEAPIPGNATPTKAMLAAFGLDQVLSEEAFSKALSGYEAITHRKKNLLTIIDFTKPSTEERMFVLDVPNQKVLFRTIVSHGRNSGDNYATQFSNKHGSFQSSLGFYLTGETYMGGNGYSLYIDGLEKDINDQARARAVVIHGADYCSKEFIRKTGRLGRSYGCPALPRELNEEIINTIKGGSLLYIYAEDEQYAMNSSILKETASEKAASLAGTSYL